MGTTILLLILSFCGYATSGKICFGTSNGLGIVHRTEIAQETYVKRLRRMYENCTTLHGNLEISHLKAWEKDLDFLSSIEQVTGYILIFQNELRRIFLPNLQIIWGDQTFSPMFENFTVDQSSSSSEVEHFESNYALMVFQNPQLETLSIPKLRAIHNGKISLNTNQRLCHWQTLDFRQLLGDDFRSRLEISKNTFSKCSPGDSQCHPQCDHCFDKPSNSCQQIYRNDCAPQCSTGTCYNTTSPLYCCHKECLGGCTGPTDSDCVACNSMRFGRKCVESCPSKNVYNKLLATYQFDPNGTYSFNRECVQECPVHMRIYRDGCVSRCPDGHYEDDQNCVPCSGACPKTCLISEAVSALNIKDFVNCTKVEGMIEIRKDAFERKAYFWPNMTKSIVDGITEDDLENLSNIHTVTDCIFIQSRQYLRSLKFLRNLETVEGRRSCQGHDGGTLVVGGNTNLAEMATPKLEQVKSGKVFIGMNGNLCGVDSIPFNDSIAPERSTVKSNAPKLYCDSMKYCHETCDQTKGCWGRGPGMCFECAKFKLHDNCINWCNMSESLYIAAEKECDFCHAECITCNGPGTHNCTQCKNVELDGECVSSCPVNFYFVDNDKKCQKCHENCHNYGCTGPGNFVGLGGCNKCDFALVDKYGILTECIHTVSVEKPCSRILNQTNYFWGTPSSNDLDLSVVNKIEKGICRPCHPECESCTNFGQEEKIHGCACKNFRVFSQGYHDSPVKCESACSVDRYHIVEHGVDQKKPSCHECDPECLGCSGHSADHCHRCRDFVFFNSSREDSNFTCVAICPTSKPFFDRNNYCTDIDEQALSEKRHKIVANWLAMSLAAMFLFLVLCVVLGTYFRRKWIRVKKLNPPDEEFEMNPEAKPDMSQLKIIVENELSMSEKPLGNGAFGVVYRGIWHPNGQNIRQPVAIKILHEATPLAQNDMLDEATIMARIRHSHLMPLIGVCLSAPSMMLVTPLMPNGNLLEFLHKKRSKLSSVDLMRYCFQIVKGMQHLEENRMVHRDLAARNVLVQTPYHIRITDFGLAKLLDYGESELKVYEGRMPIKWLALECISHKKFTHKSDVWSFGVTAWEVFTFGEKPYKNVPLKEVYNRVQRGERLAMPEICTIDVFRVLLKCWLPDPEERPTFHDLHEVFRDTFFKDPPRYLVIEGDSLKRQVQRNENLDMLDNLDLTPICDTGRTYSQEVSTPTMPSTPSKPLLRVELPPSRDCNHRNESTSSHRYALDPLGIRSIADLDLSIVTPAGMDNYLLPNSTASKSRVTDHPDLDSQQWAACEVYTPVIGGLASPQLHHNYYNDVKKFIDCPDADFIDEGISSMGAGADHQSPSTSCKSSSSVKSPDVIVVVGGNGSVDDFDRRRRFSPLSRRPTNDKTKILATENLEYILPPNCCRRTTTSYDDGQDDFATKKNAAQIMEKNSAQIFDRQDSTITGDYTIELIENESCV